MSKTAPKIALSAAFLFILPIVGGQLQGYSVAAPQSSGQSVHLKSSDWPRIQQASVIQHDQRG